MSGVTRKEAERLLLLLGKLSEERWLEPEQRDQIGLLRHTIDGWLDGIS